jgi:hypothetical protein
MGQTLGGILSHIWVAVVHHLRREGLLAQEQAEVGLPTICQPQFVKFLPHLYDRLTMNPARIVADTLT